MVALRNAVAWRGLLRAALLGSTTLCAGIAAPAIAQQTAPTPDRYLNTEEHGVDLVTGRYYLDIVEGRIGPEDGGIALIRHYGGTGMQDNWSGTIRIGSSGGQQTATISLGKIAETFVLQAGVWTSTKGNGATLANDWDGWVYRAADGTRIMYKTPESLHMGYYDPNTQLIGPGCSTGETCGLPVEVTRPAGVVYTLNWEMFQNCFQNGQPYLPGGWGGDGDYQCYSPFRMVSVTSNSSYAMAIEFDSNQSSHNGGGPAPAWFNRKSVTFLDTSQEPCGAYQCSPVGTHWPKVTYARPSTGVLEINNSQAGNWRITQSGSSLSVRKPGRSADTLIITRNASFRVTSITDDGATKNYSWSTSGGNTVVSMTDADGTDGQVVSNPAIGQPGSVTNASGQTVSNLYDGNGRLSRTTFPEGNYIEYTYDSRGNVTNTTRVGKPNSGVAAITSSANYDASCTNVLKCNKPNYIIDPGGNRTDYSYGPSHGQVTRVERPAPDTAQPRPTVDIGYSQVFAQIKDASGNLVASGDPQWKPTLFQTCSNAATCAGSAEEQRIAVAYNTPNLLPSSVTVSSGNGAISSTTAFAYDARGNLASEDGPLPGPEDTTHYFHDALDRRRGIIGPDPDGAGATRRAAARFTYDSGNNLIMGEFGSAAGTTQAALDSMTVLQAIENVYDTNGRLSVRKLVSGGLVYELTQYSYDARNRLSCTAIRMNPATWGSLPPSACTMSPSGASGPDRITRRHYDGDDRIVRVESGVGSTEVSDEFAATFGANGQAATLTDGESNRTTYVYDGHDRLHQTFYPHKFTKNYSDPADYEQLGYDAAGRASARRLRDGQWIYYGYDSLNRLIAKNLPGTEPDASYGYDLMDRMTVAVQNGQTLTFAHDALGHNTSQAGPHGAVTYLYDSAGRRSRMTWPDGFFVTYEYNVDGSITTIRENGSLALASYSYDAHGRPTAVGYANGTSQSVAFDPAGRLSALVLDLAGASADNTRTFSYNPAGQIAQSVQSNDAYAFGNLGNVDRPYSANGLNQLTHAGSVALGYDARGNLTSSGSDSFTYSSENLLTSLVGVASLTYDPFGRLYQVSSTPAVTRFAYDGTDLISEYNGANQLQRRYVHGPGIDNPLVWYESAGLSDRRFLHADERGSVIAVSNASGGLMGINSYDEYGVRDLNNIGRFQYTGQTLIPEIGLNYYKARMYSPSLGRFMQTDPIGYGDGMNIYNYVSGDPVNLIDPTGMCQNLFEWVTPGKLTISDGYFEFEYLNHAVCLDSPEGLTGSSGGNGLGAPPSAPQNEEEEEIDVRECLASVGFGVGFGALNPAATAINAGRGIFDSVNRTGPSDARLLSPDEQARPRNQGRMPSRSLTVQRGVQIIGRKIIEGHPAVRATSALFGGGVALLTDPSCGIGLGSELPAVPIL